MVGVVVGIVSRNVSVASVISECNLHYKLYYIYANLPLHLTQRSFPVAPLLYTSRARYRDPSHAYDVRTRLEYRVRYQQLACMCRVE